MKITKKNLMEFIEKWDADIDGTQHLMMAEDVLDDLEETFELKEKVKVPKTLMEVFEEEDRKENESVQSCMDDDHNPITFRSAIRELRKNT